MPRMCPTRSFFDEKVPDWIAYLMVALIRMVFVEASDKNQSTLEASF